MKQLLLLFLASGAAWGQALAPGVKVGVPLSDAFDGIPVVSFSENKRYTAGFMLDIRLPAGLGAEFDILYRRLDYSRAATGGVAGIVSDRGGAWQFPLVGKYRLGAGPVKPYGEAGLAFRHLSGLKQIDQELRTRKNSGLVLGVGVDISALVVHISPQIRYTRWGSDNFRDPSFRTERNQAEFLVGISF